MLSQSQMGAITAALPIGRKESVQVRVEYTGGDIHDPASYSFRFKGAVVTQDGILVCLGPPGTTIGANRFVVTFQAVKGNYIRDVSFVSPAGGFDFVAGIVDPDNCQNITTDNTEFMAPVAGPRETIVLVDMKKNSGNSLGYRFRVWVTHYDDAVVEVPFDPRIINR
jgi:hypothetical protein